MENPNHRADVGGVQVGTFSRLGFQPSPTKKEHGSCFIIAKLTSFLLARNSPQTNILKFWSQLVYKAFAALFLKIRPQRQRTLKVVHISLLLAEQNGLLCFLFRRAQPSLEGASVLQGIKCTDTVTEKMTPPLPALFRFLCFASLFNWEPVHYVAVTF
jgi:hypothetical protein